MEVVTPFEDGKEERVYVDAAERYERLYELGLQERVLLDAVEYGQAYALACTENDPPTLSGIEAWGKTVRKLRDSLGQLGWKRDNSHNYPTVVHPDGGFAIAACGGNCDTGKPDKIPVPRSDKGPLTKHAVNLNQLSFAGLDVPVAAEFPRPMQTRLLLYYRDEEEEETRVELALPDEITEAGWIYSWRERIILSAIPFFPVPMADDEPQEPDIDVRVERR